MMVPCKHRRIHSSALIHIHMCVCVFDVCILVQTHLCSIFLEIHFGNSFSFVLRYLPWAWCRVDIGTHQLPNTDNPGQSVLSGRVAPPLYRLSSPEQRKARPEINRTLIHQDQGPASIFSPRFPGIHKCQKGNPFSVLSERQAAKTILGWSALCLRLCLFLTGNWI